MAKVTGTGKDFYVVGIGASAGGLDAVQQLFDHIPPNTGMAFVIIQHLSPDFKSLMPELLAKHTEMPIFTAEDKQKIQPNCVYLNQRLKNLHIKGDQLYLLDKGPKKNLNLPIDIFFHTLGEEYKERSIGIILSGTGSDGSRGIKTIKEGGGTLLVQEPTSSQFDGMPNSAIATGLVDYILSPDKLADIIAKHPVPTIILDTDKKVPSTSEKAFTDILKELHSTFEIDFNHYKRNTLLRRLEKRIGINNVDNIHDYLVFLRKNPKEKRALLNDFLIGVTNFFRDEAAFEQLKLHIIPEIVHNKKDNQQIRVWAAGCSTGEEVYSLAILIDDYLTKHKSTIDFKIFATDVDSNAISQASEGRYNVNIINELEKEFTNKYFVKAGNKIQIAKRLREKIVFSQHNVIKDPPFIRMDLIVCRNLLIYLNNKTQQKILANFQFALNTYGYLFLGSSESLGEISKLFKVIDNKWKIWQNVSETKKIPHQTISTENSGLMNSEFIGDSIVRPNIRYKESPENIFFKILAHKFSPDCLFIDKECNILFLTGNVGAKLQFSEGIFHNNLLKLISTNLAQIIRSSIRKVINENKEVVVRNIHTSTSDKTISFDLNISKIELPEFEDNIFIIQFSEDRKETENYIELSNLENKGLDNDRIEELEYELKLSHAELQNVVEELETSNEELQSSNEELMASNEELQSTNEELQSVNEELYTVNAELQEKNKELSQINNDIENLLNSTEIGTLFLDYKLNIRKFTSSLTEHFHLQDDDIGRPITSFASNFNEVTRNELIEDSRKSLKELITIESEVVDYNGNYYLLRVSPFITSERHIEGVVITFVEINKLKQTTKELVEATNKLDYAHTIAKLGTWQLDIATDEVSWSKQLYDIYGFDSNLPVPPYKEHSKFYTKDSWELLSSQLEITSKTGKPYDLELEMIKANGERSWLWAVGGAVYEGDKIVGISGTAKDITERKNLLEEIKKEKLFSDQILNSSPLGIFIYDFEKGQNIFLNDQYELILGYTQEDLDKLSKDEFIDLFHPEDMPKVLQHMAEIENGVDHVKIEYRFKHKNDYWVWCYSIDSPFEIDETGEVKSFLGGFIDVTDRKQIEEELVIAKKNAEAASAQKNSFLANMSHEIRTPINGIIGFAELLKDNSISDKDRIHYLDIIDSNVAQLLRLIDDILDISKIEAEELTINKQPTDVDALMKELLEIYQQIIEFKGKKLTLELDIPSSHPFEKVNIDPIRLKQVISNLLNNAIRYSEKGTITLGYKVEKTVLEFFVKDEGIGIKEEQLDTIFTRFKQVHTSSETKLRGTGLGLTISKGIIELLNGEIFVESTFKKGSKFSFTLPIEIVSNKSLKKISGTKKKDYSRLAGKHLLVADDEPNIIKYYDAVIKKYGMIGHYAKNGKEAIDIYRKNENIDIVLMDIRMPIVDGYEAIEKILSIDAEAKIIAQTAYAMSDEEWNLLNIGCIDYMSKPIKIDVFLHRMVFWLIEHA